MVPGYRVARKPYQQYVLRICKVCDGSKTGFFVYAQEHAREWVGPLVALETANRLLKNYGTDPQTTSFVDNLDIFIDPSVNPDGGNYSMLNGGGSGQRKTMTNYCGPHNEGGAGGDVASTSFDPGSRGNWGVDDNRAFSVGSLFDGYEGASSSCTSGNYASPGELHEPEAKNEVWLESTFPNIRFSMNIHTSGGYFMWSPASYKTVNREALPYPSKGWQEEFWAAARKTVTAIKNYRGTVVTPDRTGSVVDVLYSAAGNSSDEAWYNRNIIAYDFECGVRQFSPTSTSNNGGDPGFTPNFATEGRAEGQEFADGMYGLMSSALEYQLDTTPPVDGPSVPSGTISADADLARVQRVGAVGHLLHDGRLDADDELDAVRVLRVPRAGGRDPHLHAHHDAEVVRRRSEGQHVGGAVGEVLRHPGRPLRPRRRTRRRSATARSRRARRSPPATTSRYRASIRPPTCSSSTGR